MIRGAALLAVVLVGCSGTASGPASTSSASGSAGSAVGTPTTPISVNESAYGRLVVRTAAGMRCTADVHVGLPQYGDVPPATVEGTADTTGALTIAYPAPHLPAGPGRTT